MGATEREGHRFILCYRREDSGGHTGRLADHLLNRFGQGSVFMDVESIGAGVDFTDEIERAISGSEAVLIVIGPGWVGAKDSSGRSRLALPRDFVRREIEVALDSGVRVIPVLVDGASMPSESELPESIRALVRHNALELQDRRWRQDVDVLVGVLEGRQTAPTSRPSLRHRRNVLTLAVIVGVGSIVGAVALASRGGAPAATREESAPLPTKSLLRLDPVTEKIERLTGGLLTRTDKNWISTLAAGQGGVWYVDEFPHHVDPDNGDEQGDHSEYRGYSVALAIAARDVWVGTPNEMIRIDPADDDVLSRTQMRDPSNQELGLGPTSIAAGDGRVWIAWDGGYVVPFSLGGRPGQPIDTGDLAADVVVAGGYAWVADPIAGEVVRVDTDRGVVDERIDVGGSPTALAATEDDVWVMDEAGILTSIDIATLEQGVGISIGLSPADIDAGLDAVWIGDAEGLVRELSVTQKRVVATYDVGAPIGTLAVDEREGVIWVRTIQGEGG